MEEEAMSVPVQETTQITCPPPSTATSIANLEYPEEPLPTAASVASGECPEMLPMALTESSHKYPDLPRADDPVISPEPDSLVCWMELCTYAHILYFCMCVVCLQYIQYVILYVMYVCIVCVHISIMQW